MKILNTFILILCLFQNNLKSDDNRFVGSWTICKIINKKDSLTVNFNTCHKLNFNPKNTGEYIKSKRKFKFKWCSNKEYLIIDKRNQKDKYLSMDGDKYKYQFDINEQELKLFDNDFVYILKK